MGFVARLRRGTQTIDLNASPYTLSADFVPPTTAEEPQIAESRRRRARRTGGRALTQALTVYLHVQGTSVAHVRNSIDRLNDFLKLAGKTDDPTWFDWRPDNYVSTEPVWGQFGAYRSIEVLWGEAKYGDQYGWWDHSKIVPDCKMNLVANASIEGKRQLLAEAKGGIVEDWIGTVDGRSRGVQIPEGDATNGNRMTNPIFGHATWNTGWTAAGNITASKNTDKNFVLHGLNSAKLSCSAATLKTFTQSIAAGNTNTHILSCYAKLPDGGAISATQCYIFYDSERTTTYTPVGNGWYRLSASVAGIVAATLTGISVNSTYTIYVDSFQFEERAYITPFFYGDMLGCSWLGTHHESKSFRSQSYLRLPVAGLLDAAEGTIRVVWKAGRANTTYTFTGHFLYSSVNFELRYSYITDVWQFGLAGGVLTKADTFAAGDYRIIHLTWSPSGYSLYVNNSETSGSYAYPVLGTYLYIGTDGSTLDNIGGLITGPTVWPYKMTAAEVLADYNNIAPLIADGQAVDPIPYNWTKDGDSIVDYIDSGPYRNIAIIGGVQGDAPAKTEIKMTVAGMNNPDIYVGNLDVEYRKYLNPEFLSYVPASPPDTISVNNSDVTLATISVDDDEFELLSGKSIGMMLRADEADTGNNLLVKLGINPGGAYYYSKQPLTSWILTTTSVSLDMTPDLKVVPNEDLYRLLGITRALSVRAVGKRTTAGALDFKLHSAQIMPFPLIRFINVSASGIAPTILYIDGKSYEVNSSALSYTYKSRGDKLELLPGRYNLLISYIGAEAVATDTGDTLTYNQVYYTPRWTAL